MNEFYTPDRNDSAPSPDPAAAVYDEPQACNIKMVVDDESAHNEEVRFCSSCGAAIPTASSYCMNCGATVRAFSQPQVNVSNNTTNTTINYIDNRILNSNVNTNINTDTNGMKSKKVALLLCLLFGWCGVHRFYEGKIVTGIIYACTGGLGGFGWLIDFLILLFKPRFYKP